MKLLKIIISVTILLILTTVFLYAKPIEPKMVLIKGGTFKMGAGHNDYEREYTATVSSFYIGKYEVTNKEYNQYDPNHKSCWSADSYYPPDYPVESVSWDEADGYCKWLSKKTGKNYRLPTETEWEYACRAGTTTKYYWGDDEELTKITTNEKLIMIFDYCWCNVYLIYHPQAVGQLKPNAWGLYDMSGNVWEYCSDWYGVFPSGSVTNPTGPKSGATKVIRGGSWKSNYYDCESHSRSRGDGKDYTVGFRLVRSAP